MPAMNKPIMCDSFNWENERSTVVAFKTGTAEKDIQLLGQLSSAMIWHEPCSQFKTIEINIDVFIYLNCVGFLNAQKTYSLAKISLHVWPCLECTIWVPLNHLTIQKLGWTHIECLYLKFYLHQYFDKGISERHMN